MTIIFALVFGWSIEYDASNMQEKCKPSVQSHDPRFALMRAFAMCLVVYIHSSGDLWGLEHSASTDSMVVVLMHFRQLLGDAVPLFLMIGGALLLGKDESVKIFYMKRMKRVLIPLLVWSSIVYPLKLLVDGQQLGVETPLNFLHLLVSFGVYPIYWYVYLIFALYLITPFLRPMIRGVSWYMLACLCALLLFCHFVGPAVPDVRIAHGLYSEYGIFLFFFLSGYLIRYLWENYARRRPVWVTLSVACLILQIVIGPAASAWSFVPGTCALFCLFLALPEAVAKRLDHGTKWLSDTSYGIYLTHFMFISVLLKCGWLADVPTCLRGMVLAAMVLPLNALFFLMLRKVGLGKWVM